MDLNNGCVNTYPWSNWIKLCAFPPIRLDWCKKPGFELKTEKEGLVLFREIARYVTVDIWTEHIYVKWALRKSCIGIVSLQLFIRHVPVVVQIINDPLSNKVNSTPGAEIICTVCRHSLFRWGGLVSPKVFHLPAWAPTDVREHRAVCTTVSLRPIALFLSELISHAAAPRTRQANLSTPFLIFQSANVITVIAVSVCVLCFKSRPTITLQKKNKRLRSAQLSSWKRHSVTSESSSFTLAQTAPGKCWRRSQSKP